MRGLLVLVLRVVVVLLVVDEVVVEVVDVEVEQELLGAQLRGLVAEFWGLLGSSKMKIRDVGFEKESVGL